MNHLKSALYASALVLVVLLDIFLFKIITSPEEKQKPTENTQEVCLSLRLTPGTDGDSSQLQLDNKDV